MQENPPAPESQRSQQDRHVVAGAILVVLGLGLFAMQFVPRASEGLVLMVIGAAFVVGYFIRRRYGLLIPGGILVGLGLGMVGSAAFQVQEFTTIGMGVGFISIFAIDWAYNGRSHWWPLIPGLILLASGLGQANANIQRLISVGWPLAIVLVGLLLIAAGSGIIHRGRNIL
jgi:hypothetical protein